MSFLSNAVRSSSASFAAASIYLVFLLCANLVMQVENKSSFGIGTRIIGDQLLLKDILQTPPISLTEDPVIKFKYAIEEPITYLEMESDKNVHAKVNFSYELNLIEGIISAINSQYTGGATAKPEPFAIIIQIYGFNETMPNVDDAHILNKDQQFNGILKPIYQLQNNQSFSLTEEDSKALDDFDLDLDYDDEAIDAAEDDTAGDEEDIEYEEDDFNSNYDKIVEQGQRQEGDFLVYETNQTSATSTELPTNHSVTFYYVDIYHITFVKFIIYEHYLYHPLNSYDNTYVVEYAHISPTTLKAIVTDHRTTSLFVQMQMYGFHPTALPVDYKPFLSNSQTLSATRPVSSLTQLKLLMNAQQSTTTQQQQEQKIQEKLNNINVELDKQSAELGHQISSDINCMQTIVSVPDTGNFSQRIFSFWYIFNLFVTIFGTILFSI